MNKFMQAAYEEALKNISGGEGGPFGAVIERNGEIIAAAHNQVLATNDPTMHAEIAAIRIATRKLNRFNLSDCTLYSTCEPCPMCLAAIIWAGIPKVYYGANRKDAESIGFADNYIYEYIKGTATEKKVSVRSLHRRECLQLFEQWMKKEDKVMY
jgi:guanine deaminase